jgi:outer membrane lipoprotein-sorting protein
MLAFPRRCVFLALFVLATITAPALGQSAAKKLPSAEKIVSDYLKAIGGKKAAAAQRDVTCEWTVYFGNQPFATARTLRKAPGSERFELTFGNGQIISATNARSAWQLGFDKQLRTLTSLEASTAKLQATLAASHLVDLKKANVLARVPSLGDLATDPAYIVEFSTRSGARVQYYFSVRSKLITKITSDTLKTRLVFEDYRAEHGLLQPHRVRMSLQGQPDLTSTSNVASTSNVRPTSDSATNNTPALTNELTLMLQSVTQNTGIDDGLFDPPAATESLDITALLHEVALNQDATEQRVSEYSFKQTETDRTINDKGEVKKESLKVFEVFPLPNREPVQKLISENGVPLSAERAAKEDKRVQEEFLKAEREKDKDAQDAARRRAEREKKNKKDDEDADPAISRFLRACDFVSPRRERFEGRDSIVFDFRPRAGFKPKTREESLIAKLIGVVWIDPVDKQVIRLEARLAEGFKMAGGLLVSLKPGAALVMEQTRMAEGVWLPRFAQINLSVKVLLFAGGDFNKTIEWSDYKHFSGDVKDYKLDAPAGVKP